MSDERVLSFKRAKALGLISQKEIERFAAVGLCSPAANLNYALLASETDSTPGSFQVMLRSTLRKLAKENCYIGVGDEDLPVVKDETASKKKGGRKRKEAVNGDETTAAGPKKMKKTKTQEELTEQGDEEEVDMFSC